jgi:hypothetical protein
LPGEGVLGTGVLRGALAIPSLNDLSIGYTAERSLSVVFTRPASRVASVDLVYIRIAVLTSGILVVLAADDVSFAGTS